MEMLKIISNAIGSLIIMHLSVSAASSHHHHSSSSSSSSTTTTNTKSTPPPPPNPELVRLEHQPDTTNYPAVIAGMKAAAAKDGAILPSSACDSHLNSFIKPLKEQRFTIIADCVKVAGVLTWTNYFNEDGDANFNLLLDPQYEGMLGLGNYGRIFEIKYHTTGAIHVEIPCQGPVTSTNVALNVGACDGYDSFKLSKAQLPKIGDHVMVTGRYLIEIPEMPGGMPFDLNGREIQTDIRCWVVDSIT
jgi:hypothetical protein